MKENAEAAPPPERMVDAGVNLVTPEGLREIVAHVGRLEAALESERDVLQRETLARDLRYWAARQASAEIAPPPAGDRIAFGSRVVIRRNGREQKFRIVGVDEAEPSSGLVSIRAPLAAAVIGARKGEIVEASPPLGEIEILDIAD